MGVLDEITEPGPTGKFPDGKCSPTDRGELAIGVAINFAEGLIEINFGVPVTWLALEPAQAIVFADGILAHINILEESQKENHETERRETHDI